MTPEATRSTCWVVSDGAAGNERQALALARAMALEPRVLRLSLARPWDWLAPRLTLGARHAMRDASTYPIDGPWPDIAIGCGRKAALLTRCVRAWSGGRCFSVQILDPRISSAHFDIVVAPRHDRLDGDNVIATLGALNAIDAQWLADGRAQFSHLSEWPSPRVGVLVGASHRGQALDQTYFDAMLASLRDLRARHGGSFLVSTSRRTPAPLAERLREAFAQWPGTFWAGPDDGENPYAGILAWAERLVVTADSVNMISEACATGKPVHAFTAKPVLGKLGDFHRRLVELGYLGPIDANGSPAPGPLRETAEVAAQIRRRWTAAR